MDLDGWHPDPFGIHEERLFKDGKPTPLVKDAGVGSYDEPPDLSNSDAASSTPTTTTSATPNQEPSPGVGWWLASDGKWYPPKQQPADQPPEAPLSVPLTPMAPAQIVPADGQFTQTTSAPPSYADTAAGPGAGSTSKIAVRLNPEEEILRDELQSPFWTVGRYIVTLGLWAIWRSRHHFLLTNQRVLIVKGIVSKSEQAVPLARIQDVSLQRSLLAGGHVQLSSAGGGLGIERMGPLTHDRARQFADAISHVLPTRGDGVSADGSTVQRSTPSVSEELLRLAGLRDSGILTEEEFATQKAKLLNN